MIVILFIIQGSFLFHLASNFFFAKFYLCFLDELVRILFLTSVLMFAYCWEHVSK